ncbi:hypothetical protein ACJA3G_29830, partial [Streptomyces sp. YS-3]
MSRETDSSTSGPQGRGGAAYPSGTPPYGTPHSPAHDAPEAAAQPDEPKTETTLTTRIRINIPGSRPIPPVVMRTPVSDADKASAAARGERERAAAEAEEAATAAAAEEKPASDWFAPRRAGSGATPPSGTPRSGLPYFSDGPQGAPDDGSVTGSFARPGDNGDGNGFAGPGGTDGHGFSAGPAGPGAEDHGFAAGGPDATGGFRPGPASANGSGRAASGGNGGPAGPTTGPVTGTSALPARPVGPRKGQQRLGGAPDGQGPGPGGTPSRCWP